MAGAFWQQGWGSDGRGGQSDAVGQEILIGCWKAGAKLRMPDIPCRIWPSAYRLAVVVLVVKAFLGLPEPVIAVAVEAIREDDAPLLAVEGPLHTVRQPQAAEVSVHLIFGHSARPSEMHYVEHLTWLNMTGNAISEQDSNAWTTHNAAGYRLVGSANELDTMLHTLARAFAPIRLSERFAEQERDIILREHDLRMKTDPDARVTWKMQAFLYEGTVLAAPVIGTPEEIRKFDFSSAKALHAATHRPDRAFLVVVGNISPEQVHVAMRRSGFPVLGGGERRYAPLRLHLKPPEKRRFRFRQYAGLRLVWRKTVTLNAPVQFDLLEARCALLGGLLRANLPGGLAGPLLYDGALVRRFDIRIRALDESHVEMRFEAAPDGNVSLQRLLVAFEGGLADVAVAGIPERTFVRVRNRFDTFWPDWNDRQQTAEWLGRYVLRRISALRRPMKIPQLRSLSRKLDGSSLNVLLRSLAGPGRTAVAFLEDVRGKSR